VAERPPQPLPTKRMNIQRFWSGTPVLAGRWTLKEAIQGKPIHHPTHALFAHFPAALLPVAFRGKALRDPYQESGRGGCWRWASAGI